MNCTDNTFYSRCNAKKLSHFRLYLPEVQDSSPHFRRCCPNDPDTETTVSVQSAPPWAGAGWSQLRDRIWLPPPQDTEHSLHSLHSDQPPLIAINVNNDSFSKWIWSSLGLSENTKNSISIDLVTPILANQWCAPSNLIILSTFSLAISETRLSMLKFLWFWCPYSVTGSFTLGFISYHWSIRAISFSPLFHEVEFRWIWLRNKNSTQHICSWHH